MLCKVILFLTQYGIFIRYHSEEMKIFANSIAEKTKSERDADIFKMRYTEKHQSENININEKIDNNILYLISEFILKPLFKFTRLLLNTLRLSRKGEYGH